MARVLIRGKLTDTSSRKKDWRKRGTDHAKRSGAVRDAGVCKRKGRKLNRWNENRMKLAINEFKEGKKGLREIARAWQVPKSTLARRVTGDGIAAGWKHASGKKPVLPNEVEMDLAERVMLLAKRGFPLTRKDVQKVAFEYAVENNIPGFNPERGSAGHYWFKGFINRHPEISVKKPENLSVGRAIGMNRQVVSNWFDMYSETLNELGIRDCPSHIWNADESGLQDFFVSDKVLSVKGKPCYEINSCEKGQTTTVIATFNGVGKFLPPMIIFKGKRMKPEWCIGAPLGSVVRVSEKGWITSELFVEWGKMFVKNMPADETRPHLLLLDGHGTHVFNLEFLKLMKENNIHLMCFPAHTTHWLQPADKTFFKSLKHKWTEAGRTFSRDNGGKKPDKKEFFQLLTPAWTGSSTVEIAQSGFRETGMFPVNKDAIPQHAFEPSLTTERPLPQNAGLLVACEGCRPKFHLACDRPIGLCTCRQTDSVTVLLMPYNLFDICFLQRCCKRCISHGNSVCLSVCLSVHSSVTRWYPTQTNEDRIMR